MRARPLTALLPLLFALPAQAQPAPAGPAPAPAATAPPQLVIAAPPTDVDGKILLPRDTMVRLMVLNEVNTHKHKPGHRFVLRVDEAVEVAGRVLVPVGAKAWGEVTEIEENKGLGKAGSIGARLLHIEADGGAVPLTGEDRSRGIKGGTRVAFAIAAFGPFGFLARGSQGKLKAGHIFNGYVAADMLYDPASGRFTTLDAAADTATEAGLAGAAEPTP